MYRKLLVPLDGSVFSEHALAPAASIAARAGSTLWLVLVHHPTHLVTEELGPTPILESWEADRREREEAYLDSRAAELREQGLEVVTELRRGDVARELTDLAAEADLLVLATHGRGGLERAWLGSVADYLIRHAPAPLLLIRPVDDREDGARMEASHLPQAKEPRHILAATGGSAAATSAVEHAAELARSFDARLTLLRVVAFPGGLASPYIPHAAEMDRAAVEAGEAQAGEALAELAARFTDLDVRTRVTRGFHAAREILAVAADEGADMVAVGSHRRSVLGRTVLGSTADKVVRASTIPVLVAHAPE